MLRDYKSKLGLAVRRGYEMAAYRLSRGRSLLINYLRFSYTKLEETALWWYRLARKELKLALLLLVACMIVVAGAGALFLRIVRPRTNIIVTRFEVASNASWTGKEVADCLIDQMLLIEQRAVSLTVSPIPTSQPYGQEFLLFTRPPDPPSVQSEVHGLVRIVMSYLTKLRENQHKVTGELFQSADRLVLRARIDNGTALQTEAHGLRDEELKVACKELALKVLSEHSGGIVGLFYLSEGNQVNALAAFNKWVGQEPSKALPYFYRGNTFFRDGHYDKAKIDLIKILDFEPNSADVLNNLGLALEIEGKYNDAIGLYRRALARNPNRFSTLENLGIALARADYGNEAIQTFRKGITLRPNDFGGLLNLGVTLANERQSDQAITVLQSALKLQPGYPGVLTALGLAYLNKQSYDEAIAAYQKGLGLEPNYPEAQANLCLAFYWRQRYDDAIASCETALKLNPRIVDAWDTIGLAHYSKCQFREAVAAFRESLALKPKGYKILSNLGVALTRAGQYEEAATKLQMALELKPESLETLSYLGVALLHDKPNEAVVVLQKAVALKPDEPGNHYNLALALKKAGRPEEAQKEFAEVRRLYPTFDPRRGFGKKGPPDALGCSQSPVR